MNQVVLIGRLVADPQLRYSQDGTAVTNFRLAVERPYPGRDGKREADFIDCVAWRKLAEVIANNLTKGRLVAVNGRLQIREFEYEGQRRRHAEVVIENIKFLDKPKTGAQGGGSAGGDGDWFKEDSIPF